MKIAVVGAAGFIGRALVEFLRRQGAEALPIDISGPETLSGFKLLRKDVLSGSLGLPSGLDALVYLAQSPKYKDPSCHELPELLRVNANGCVNACEEAIRAGAKLFFYASTGNVCEPSFLPLSESSPLRADNDPYACSKLAAEDALKAFSSRIGICVTRLFGIYGPGQRQRLPALIQERIKAGTPIELHPRSGPESDQDGLKVSFMYIDDFCACLGSLLETGLQSPFALPPVINLAGERGVSIKEFASLMGEELGVKPVLELSSVSRAFDLVADISLLKKTLAPRFTPLREALAKTVRPAN